MAARQESGQAGVAQFVTRLSDIGQCAWSNVLFKSYSVNLHVFRDKARPWPTCVTHEKLVSVSGRDVVDGRYFNHCGGRVIFGWINVGRSLVVVDRHVSSGLLGRSVIVLEE